LRWRSASQEIATRAASSWSGGRRGKKSAGGRGGDMAESCSGHRRAGDRRPFSAWHEPVHERRRRQDGAGVALGLRVLVNRTGRSAPEPMSTTSTCRWFGSRNPAVPAATRV
jgi:hypothetical protein